MKELPQCQIEQNCTYQIDSIEKGIHKKFFAAADSLVDKILSCPRIKPSTFQNLTLDGVKT